MMLLKAITCGKGFRRVESLHQIIVRIDGQKAALICHNLANAFSGSTHICYIALRQTGPRTSNKREKHG